MNKTVIRKFAIWSRQQLLLSVKQKAFSYDIVSNENMFPEADIISGHPISQTEKQQRRELIDQIRKNGYEAVMEEVAFTWFNRFIALRFMEVNGYLPSKIRLFTDENGSFKPEVLKQALSVEIKGLDRSRILEYLEKQDNEGLYRYLLITQCNSLNAALPSMFEPISNWTELLLPDNLLNSGSFLAHMISDIPEEDWLDQVQIIGWLYQYYNSERKDSIQSILKKKGEISREQIPVITQLYTPDWIVQYLVQNSLGRIAIRNIVSNYCCNMSESERIEKENTIAAEFGWKYYIPEAKQEPEAQKQLNQFHTSPIALQSLKLIDPCMGSGHVLVYAFDVFMQMYRNEGWSDRDAVKSILENNLWGLDIDQRAGQLAYFSVMMKARKYDRKVFSEGISPNILSICDSAFIDNDLIDYISGNDEKLREILQEIKNKFIDARALGSLLIYSGQDIDLLKIKLNKLIDSDSSDFLSARYNNTIKEKLLPLIHQSEVLSESYDVVCTNPPYMGLKTMPGFMRAFLSEQFPAGKHDLATAFFERCINFCRTGGIVSMITMDSWLHLSTFQELRNKLSTQECFINLAKVEEPELDSVETVMSVFRNEYIEDYYSNVQPDLSLNTWMEPHSIQISQMKNLPGSQISCTVTDSILNSISTNSTLSNYCELLTGLQTGDNDRFCRFWFEVSNNNIEKDAVDEDSAAKSGKRWYPYNKGGGFRKWYGLRQEIVNWENNGAALSDFRNSGGSVMMIGKDKYFKPGLTWNLNTFGRLSLRYSPEGAIIGNGGPGCFAEKTILMYILGFLNSIVAARLVNVFNPGRNCSPGTLGILPFNYDGNSSEHITNISTECIEISKMDWDSSETSMDFLKHPLL